LDERCYKTIEAFAQAQFTEKRSIFIGALMPAKTEQEALDFIAKIKSENREATHNVYAYIIREGNLRRFSDDGEPSGTAGRPVLEVLEKEGLTNVAAVVTRYFGGTLLGAGGLVRAYTRAVKDAVDASAILVMRPAAVIELHTDYTLYGKLLYILPNYSASVEKSEFGSDIFLQIVLPKTQLEAFGKELGELSSGAVSPTLIAEEYRHIPEN